MSIAQIEKYLSERDKVIQYGGSRNEEQIKSCFERLINHYADKQNLFLVRELAQKATNNRVIPDGTLKNALRLDFGFWESKDSKDEIDKEIQVKFAKGYPRNNILFEDSMQAILYQNGQEYGRVSFTDKHKLHQLLVQFTAYIPPEVKEFQAALEQFTADIPQIAQQFVELIQQQHQTNIGFQQAHSQFHETCKLAINKEITTDDIDEMLVQHVLTKELFGSIFNDLDFVNSNNIAKEVNTIVTTFLNRQERMNLLSKIEHYYSTLSAHAKQIDDHHEKQKFLKAVYESFYKAYNPKMADRLGVVYTPTEIVHFMIDSSKHLLAEHFGKTLGSPGVEILDPATGTGTFICELIEEIPKKDLQYKYEHELNANEVAILPYYIASLNIEYTYRQKMGTHQDFNGLCFADTLDKTDALTIEREVAKDTKVSQHPNIPGLFTENAARITKQNKKTISLIIGNPPYNAKQANYNHFNSNRKYPFIDQRIKETYAKQGTAQNKNMLYDMYVRFIRYASDRLQDNGIVAFVCNNSFIDAMALDGLRSCIMQDFQSVYIVDLGGNVRASRGKGTAVGNVFDIMVGVAIIFLVRNPELKTTPLHYTSVDDELPRSEKLDWLQSNPFDKIDFKQIVPSKQNHWLQQTSSDWHSLIPLINKQVKANKPATEGETPLFTTFSRGVCSQRDEWVYDFNVANLQTKMQYFIKVYQQTVKVFIAKKKNATQLKMQKLEQISKELIADNDSISWDDDLAKYLKGGIEKSYNQEQIVRSLYRPFTTMHLYYDKNFNGRTYQWPNIWRKEQPNIYLCFNSLGMDRPFTCIMSNTINDVQLLPNGQNVPLYYWTKEGEKRSNVTEYGLNQFRKHYQDEAIMAESIWHYCYAVLHLSSYREKYAVDLKRSFPRIPLLGSTKEDFAHYQSIGQQLAELHINFATVEPFACQREEANSKKPQKKKAIDGPLFSDSPSEEPQQAEPELVLLPKLKSDSANGTIRIDNQTTLTNIPPIAWSYRLGNRSAIDWPLERYRQALKIKDPTIAELVPAFSFAEHKEGIIDLVCRVITVSLQTVELLQTLESVANKHQEK